MIPNWKCTNNSRILLNAEFKMLNGLPMQLGITLAVWLIGGCCVYHMWCSFSMLSSILKGIFPTLGSYRCKLSFLAGSFMEDPKDEEWLAYWCGPANKQGDFLTYHVLLCDTEKLIQQSNICPAKDPLFPNWNQTIIPADGDFSSFSPKPVVHSTGDQFKECIHNRILS